MKVIKYTLIADGSSDRTLLKVIKWLLDDLYPTIPNESQFADFRYLPNPPKKLPEKIQKAKEYFPYDILFVHRDAEKFQIQERIQEVHKILSEEDIAKTVCVIPVKMMEAWLLINIEAIKQAAGNRHYDGEMILPQLKKLEQLPDPKEILYSLLKNASGLKGRNLDKFNYKQAVHWVADNIEDYSSLRVLEAFKAFEKDLKQKIETLAMSSI